MIKVISGPKGFGKTKLIIGEANNIVKEAKGIVIFIDDTKRYMYDLAKEIKVIDSNDYHITGEDALIGFVKGIVACNSDIEYIYLDGAARIAGKPLGEMAAFFYMLEKLAEDNGITVTLTASCKEDELPDFVAKYL